MLQEFINEWNDAVENRTVMEEYSSNNGKSVRKLSKIEFRDVEITLTEINEFGNTRYTLYVPSTSKIINPKCIIYDRKDQDGYKENLWKTMVGVLKGITLGDENENNFLIRKRLQLKSYLKNAYSNIRKQLIDTNAYNEQDIKLFMGVYKKHVTADNVNRANKIINILVKFANDIVGKNDNYKSNIKYIDKMYEMFVNIFNKRYMRNNMYTVSMKDLNYLFKREISSPNIPPIYKKIRTITSEIYDASESSTTFVYVAELLCAYYAKVTCTPYEIKLAKMQQRDQTVRIRKDKHNNLFTKNYHVGNFKDVPGFADVENLNLE